MRNGVAFARGKFRLKLVGDRFRDLTLNREYVVEWTIVDLRPKMPVSACIDELRVHSHFPAGALHAAFEQMSDAELLADLRQVALRATFILHDRSAADHFQVRDLRQVGQDFILHAVCEIGVLLVIAQVVEW